MNDPIPCANCGTESRAAARHDNHMCHLCLAQQKRKEGR